MLDLIPLVTALALDRPICVGCLVDQTGATTRALSDTIEQISRALTARQDVGRCRDCGDVGAVVSFGCPALDTAPLD
jgi:hypothetical protein